MEQKKQRNSRRQIWQAAGMALLGTGAAQAQESGVWTPKKQSAGGTIRSGHLLFLSGIGGWYPDERPKPGDVKLQTGDALQMMKASLEKGRFVVTKRPQGAGCSSRSGKELGGNGRGVQHIFHR